MSPAWIRSLCAETHRKVVFCAALYENGEGALAFASWDGNSLRAGKNHHPDKADRDMDANMNDQSAAPALSRDPDSMPRSSNL
jgi:hypothetical protein